MQPEQDRIQRLNQLRTGRKFADSDWENRGLIPSASEKIDEMVRLMNLCLDELLTDLASGAAERQIRKTLTRGLKRYKANEYDTEEKEFIADEFQKIGAVLELSIAGDLNIWLYGRVLGTIVNLAKSKPKIIRSQAVTCPGCKLTLTMNVTAERTGVPSFWVIGQCLQCGEYSLFSTGENFGRISFENFASREDLDGSITTEAQAQMRLEQIRYFRGRS